jgi:hypothetical protein
MMPASSARQTGVRLVEVGSPVLARHPAPRVSGGRGRGRGQSAAAAEVELLLLELSVVDSLLAGVLSDSEEAPLPLVETEEEELRLSVTYQPLPLKTIAGGVNTRRASIPQTSQVWTAGASKPSRFSY